MAFDKKRSSSRDSFLAIPFSKVCEQRKYCRVRLGPLVIQVFWNEFKMCEAQARSYLSIQLIWVWQQLSRSYWIAEKKNMLYKLTSEFLGFTITSLNKPKPTHTISNKRCLCTLKLAHNGHVFLTGILTAWHATIIATT